MHCSYMVDSLIPLRYTASRQPIFRLRIIASDFHIHVSLIDLYNQYRWHSRSPSTTIRRCLGVVISDVVHPRARASYHK